MHPARLMSFLKVGPLFFVCIVYLCDGSNTVIHNPKRSGLGRGLEGGLSKGRLVFVCGLVMSFPVSVSEEGWQEARRPPALHCGLPVTA